jgi:hypothetical protein
MRMPDSTQLSVLCLSWINYELRKEAERQAVVSALQPNVLDRTRHAMAACTSAMSLWFVKIFSS